MNLYQMLLTRRRPTISRRGRKACLHIESLEQRSMMAVVLPSLPAGSQYQLAFVTSGMRDAASSTIGDYNAFVAGQAANNKDLPAATWRAVASTPSVDAKANALTYESVPIYNTNGQLIATGASTWWHPSHSASIAYDEHGLYYSARCVWTGSNPDGTKANPLGGSSQAATYGQSEKSNRGWINADYWDWNWNAAPFYALSSVITVSSPVSAPSAPSGVVATPGNAQVALTWTAPASNGGTAITDYVVDYRTDSGSSWTRFNDGVSTATGTTVSGLTNGTAYVFRVSALNSAGAGPSSSGLAAVIPRTVPPAPTSLVGVAGNSEVMLSWRAPVSNGGVAITDYVIQYRPSFDSVWKDFKDPVSLETSARVTGLKNGVEYRFRVRAVNFAGVGEFSRITVTPRTLPGAPTEIVARAGDTVVHLAWQAPLTNGGSPITDYVIHYKATTARIWTEFRDGISTARTATVTGLKNGVTYEFRVFARNAVGSSRAFALSQPVTPGVAGIKLVSPKEMVR